MKKTKKVLASLAIAGMTMTMIPFNAFANGTVPTRLAGITAEQTAVAIADQTGYTGTAILASSASYGASDALTAGPLAAFLKAPILLQGPGAALNADTKAELTKLNVTKVYVTSGTAVISQAVLDELKGMGITVESLGGNDRFETSVNIAKKMVELGAPVNKVAVAYGWLNQDALSIASIASAANEPIILTEKAGLSASAKAFLAENLGITAADVIGGTGVIDASVMAQLPNPTRHFGNTAYDTNNQVIQDFASSLEFDNVYVANGKTGIDALAGAPLAAQTKSAIVLTDGASVPAAAAFTFSKSSASSVVTALGGTAVVPEGIRAGVAAGQVTTVPGDLAVVSVNTLTEDGRYIEVDFNKALGSVDKSQFEIRKSGSGERVGIESATLSANGQTVELVAYDAGENVDELEAGVAYTLTFTMNGQTGSFNFERSNYLDDRDDARVTGIDAENKDFTVEYDQGEVTIEVPEGVKFDYEAALGMEVRVWYNGEKQLVKSEIVDSSKALYDAFEVSKTVDQDNGKGEIELQTADKKYDLATDDAGKINTEYYLNGSEKTDINDLADAEYAKVIINDKGDVAYIYAYDFDDMMVVTSVDGNVVKGLGDEDIDLEDFVIVKDGKTIQVADLKAGDAVYYNESADNSAGETGYAVVYNKSVTGNIETLYDDSFVVEGKKYNYDTIKYLDEKNEIQDSFTKDDAEDFEADEVTIYVDFNGDIQLLTGIQGEGNKVGALITATPKVYTDSKGEVAAELEYVTNDLEEELGDVYFENLDTITVDGTSYDIEQDAAENQDYIVKAVAGQANQFTINVNDATDSTVKATVNLTDNTPIILTLDDEGNITDLEVISDSQKDTLKEDVEKGDSNAKLANDGSKKLKSNTVIFVAKDGALTDAEDVKAYKFADIDFDIDKEAAEVYYNEEGDVEFIVVTDTVAENTTDYMAVVDSFETTDGDVTRLVAYVNGTKKTYTVDDVEVANVVNALKDGQVVKIEVNDDNGEVEDIFVPGNVDELSADYFLLNQTGATNVGSDKFTLEGVEYHKGDNFQIIDATTRNDLDTETSLRSIEGKKFHVILDAEKSRYVSTIVIIGDEGAADDTNYGF